MMDGSHATSPIPTDDVAAALDRTRQLMLRVWIAFCRQATADEIEAERMATGRAMSDIARLAE